jgi:hypothetical protein
VRFQEAIPTKTSPHANTCPMVLEIPTVYTSFDMFCTAMDKAVAFGKCGFGKM